MRKGILSKVGAVGLVAGLIVAGWFVYSETGRDKARAAAAAPTPAVPVTVGTVERKDVPVIVRGIGTVQAYNQAVIKTRVDGELQKVPFTEGQDVKTGDLLAQIDPRPFQATLDQATAKKVQDEAQLANAKLDLQRYVNLATRDFATKQQLDTQQASVDQLEAQINAYGTVPFESAKNAQRAVVDALCRLSRAGQVAFNDPEDMVA